MYGEHQDADAKTGRHTHYHLYFVEQDERLYVLAVWSVYRGRGPKL